MRRRQRELGEMGPSQNKIRTRTFRHIWPVDRKNARASHLAASSESRRPLADSHGTWQYRVSTKDNRSESNVKPANRRNGRTLCDRTLAADSKMCIDDPALPRRSQQQARNRNGGSVAWSAHS